MKIDVVIPTYKPGKQLFTLLDKLEAQSVPPRHIILMNTEKEFFDRLAQGIPMEEKYPNLRVYHIAKKDFDHGGTRHQGVQYSDADIFIAMTQDAMPVDEYLVEKLTRNLVGETAAAYARQLPGQDSSEFERISRYFNYPEKSSVKTVADMKTKGVKTFFCSNVCAAYRRDIYEELGGFVRHTIFNEDMIYAAGVIRAGYAVSYEAEAEVIHAHNYTNMQQLRRNFDLGVSQADHPEVFDSVSSEAEGKKLVRETWRMLKKEKRLHRFPGFCIQCGFKYAGYLLGKHYRSLPRGLVLRITTNREYWKQADCAGQ